MYVSAYDVTYHLKEIPTSTDPPPTLYRLINFHAIPINIKVYSKFINNSFLLYYWHLIPIEILFASHPFKFITLV